MTSVQNPHSGQEALYNSMMQWGAMIATPSYTDPVIFRAEGSPYGISVTIGQNGKMIEDVKAAVKHHAKRTGAEWVKKENQ